MKPICKLKSRRSPNPELRASVGSPRSLSLLPALLLAALMWTGSAFATVLVNGTFDTGVTLTNWYWTAGSIQNPPVTGQARNLNSTYNQFFTTAFTPTTLNVGDKLVVLFDYDASSANVNSVWVGLFAGTLPTANGWNQWASTGVPSADWAGYQARLRLGGGSHELKRVGAADNHPFWDGALLATDAKPSLSTTPGTFRAGRLTLENTGAAVSVALQEGPSLGALAPVLSGSDAGVSRLTNSFRNAAFYFSTTSGNGDMRYDNVTVEFIPAMLSTPLSLTNARVEAGQFASTVSGAAGQAVVVQSSTNLVAWTDIAALGATNEFRTAFSITAPRIFYRARFSSITNPPPAARDDSYTTGQNVALNVADPGVLANDSGATSNALSAAVGAGPAHGTLVLNGNGSFTYTPATNYVGTDSFTYRASDGVATSALATVTLTVAPAYGTAGNRILKNGVPFEWRGANKMDVFSGTPADLTAWGMDIVREPVDMKLTSLTKLQSIVNNARAAGKVTILCAMWYDNNAFVGGTTSYPDCQLLGVNPSQDARWSAITNRWRDIANQFKDQPDVWFDLWNEPYWWDAGHGYSDALWLGDMSALVDNIRSTGAANLCLVPGSATGQGHQVFINQGPALLGGRSNLVFELHCYVAKWNVSQATAESRFQTVLKAGCPLLIGEYGAGNPFTNILSAARSKQISTVAWLWKASDTDNEALLRADGLTPNDVGDYTLGSLVRAYCLEQRNGSTRPVSPSNLTAMSVSSSRINLTWQDNATNEAGYTIERSTDGVNFTPIANLAANSTSYASTGLTSQTTYHYRVLAVTSTGGSAYSNVASAKTQ